jgi:AcrR family transcriptional regulator
MKPTVEPRCPPHDCEDTRERILAAAQKLFADKGFDATSVRDITTEAGCNVASVNYHFGGKESLYLETFRSMLAELRGQRLAVLEELIGREPTPTLEEFLRLFADGFIDPLTYESHGRMFMALVSREMVDPRLPHEVFFREFVHPVLERAMVALSESGPKLEPETARMCIMAIVGQLLHALRAHHLFAHHESTLGYPEHLRAYIPHFVRFAAGGIRACAENEVVELEDANLAEVTP